MPGNKDFMSLTINQKDDGKKQQLYAPPFQYQIICHYCQNVEPNIKKCMQIKTSIKYILFFYQKQYIDSNGNKEAMQTGIWYLHHSTVSLNPCFQKSVELRACSTITAHVVHKY